MAKLDTDTLFAICKPPRDLSNVISQYDNEIALEKARRAGENPETPRQKGGDDMATLVEARLKGDKLIASFSPFELISKMHYVIRGKDSAGNKTVQEVSYPLHYGAVGSEKEIRVETPALLLGSENFENQYRNAVETFITANQKVLRQQISTYVDNININRRLISKNLRCIPCTDRTLKCFRFDWVEKKLL
jgi:hypothetical protein